MRHRHPGWCRPLGRWVAREGPRAAAAAIGAQGAPVTASAVYSWIYGEAVPRPVVARAIVAASAGAVSFADLYLHPTPAPSPS